jgi:hypothetical protein
MKRRHRFNFRGIGLPILLLTAVTATLYPALQALAEIPVQGVSRYERTVLSLQTSTPDLQADFANTALMELVEVYLAEADLARSQAQQDDGRAKLLGWSRSVDQYANQLLLVQEDIETGWPISFQSNTPGAVAMMVGGKVVILSHPRVDQQSSFEQRVLLNFCARNTCQTLTVTDSEAEPIPISASEVQPVWTFTESGPVCAHDGVEVRFESTDRLARSRITCKQLLQEMAILVAEIAWQQRHNVVIEWEKLAVRATPQRPQHLVQLNTAGDSILVTLPLIYSTPDLLGHLAPWLEARGTGKDVPVLRLNAAEYGWERTGD